MDTARHGSTICVQGFYVHGCLLALGKMECAPRGLLYNVAQVKKLRMKKCKSVCSFVNLCLSGSFSSIPIGIINL